MRRMRTGDTDRARLSFRAFPPLWRRADFVSELAAYRDVFDEVMLFTQVTHGVLPVERIAQVAAEAKPLFDALREAGFGAGFNHLCTIGHRHEEAGVTLDPACQLITSWNGYAQPSCFCPRDAKVHDYVRASIAALAEAKPDFIWVDDDIRFEKHGAATHTCFCDGCVERFAPGTTRTQLVESLNNGDIARRKQWLAFNRDGLAQLYMVIADAVAHADPAITLGGMSGELWYSGHAYGQWATALGGGDASKVKWRPGGGFWSDSVPADLLAKAHSVGRQSVPMRRAGVRDLQVEVENFPYDHRKSAAITALEIAAAIASGATGAAMNLCGLVPDPIGEYQPYLDALRAWRGFYDRLAQTFGDSQPRGIHLACNDDWYAGLQRDGNWFDAGSWIMPTGLSQLTDIGLPFAYDAQDAALSMLTGSCCAAMTADEFAAVLRGGVMMDGEALHHCHAAGLGALTGFDIAQVHEGGAVECFTAHDLNGDGAGEHRDARPTFFQQPTYALQLAAGAQALSEAHDLAGRAIGAVSGVYENAEGGRVAVFGYSPWRSCQTRAKANQLRATCRWLSRERLPAWSASADRMALWSRADGEGRPAVMVMTTSLDGAAAARVMIRDAPAVMKLTRPNLSEEPLTRLKVDGPYGLYALPTLGPWTCGLISAG